MELIVNSEHLTVGIDGQVVRVAGEVDIAARASIEDAVNRADADHPVMFDLSAVTFLDSAGLACLIAATRRPAGARLASTSAVVERILEFTDTEDLFVD